MASLELGNYVVVVQTLGGSKALDIKLVLSPYSNKRKLDGSQEHGSAGTWLAG
jgi:hypothetical protein